MTDNMIPSEATTAGRIRQSFRKELARSEAQPVTVTVRPEVAQFAEAMERKLAANDHKEHWRGESTHSLLSRLFDEFLELQQAIDDGNAEEIVSEAADVGNFAMMIADVAGQGGS